MEGSQVTFTYVLSLSKEIDVNSNYESFKLRNYQGAIRMNNFILMETIGKGGFAKVKRVIRNTDKGDFEYAAKVQSRYTLVEINRSLIKVLSPDKEQSDMIKRVSPI